MNYKSVYRSLQEIFPQVDLRILKAVAIEHHSDVDSAVEFILLEVLPSIGSPQVECHPPLQDPVESPKVTGKASIPEITSLPENEGAASLHAHPTIEADNFHGINYTTTLHAKSMGFDATMRGSSSVEFVEKLKDNTGPDSMEVLSEATNLNPSERMPTNSYNTVASDTKTANTLLDVSISVSKNNSILPMGEKVNDSPFVQDPCSSGHQFLKQNVEEPAQLFDNHLKQNVVPSIALSLMQSKYTVVEMNSPSQEDTQEPLSLNVSSTLRDTSQDNCESSIEENMVSLKKHLVDENLGTTSVQCGNVMFSVDNDAEMSNSARSASAVNIGYLEEFVTDCKGIKHTLVSAMESIVDMMKEVNLQEKQASQAEEAASKAGLDILEKVADLKEMLKHAKEANNMHAGEVYGEKSILATEAKELQARLLSLSDQRHKFLSMIEEIHQKLEARLVAAQRERAKAEQEKLEKEERARKALIEQEEIMETVVQESKELQREAEENSKLREFLMERGRLLDTLQGEISVVCEDVSALKELVDGYVPLSRTLSSSQVLCSLASSTSSRTSASSDRLPSPPGSSDGQETSQNPQQTEEASILKRSLEKPAAVEGASSRVMWDDDWEYFDGEAELGS